MDCSIISGHLMRSIVAISTLLLGVFLLLTGNGLVGTLLGVRGDIEGFSSTIIGSISAAYYGGFVVGTFLVPHLIRAAGHVRTFTALASLRSEERRVGRESGGRWRAGTGHTAGA